MWIVLFDIDGTLVSKHGSEASERERFRRAVFDSVGKSPPVEAWRYDGMLDPEICRQLLLEVGLNAQETGQLLQRVIARAGEVYLTSGNRPSLNEGVVELLRILSASPNHRLGVLTGNLSVVAEEKLRLTGIRSHFATAFYSDGYFDRRDLVRDAIRTCVTKYRLQGSEAVVIVGDTPRDMEAANANDAQAIGVASGFYSADELKATGAAVVFRSLEPSEELLSALHARTGRHLPFRAVY